MNHCSVFLYPRKIKFSPANLCMCVCAHVAWCPTLCDPMDCRAPRLFSPWDSPGKNTGVGYHFLLQGSSWPRGWTCILCLLHLLHWQADSLPLVPPRKLISVQFSSVTQSCLTLCNPMNRSMPGLAVHHQLPESTQTHVHCVRDAIQPSHPVSSPSPALNLFQNQGLFQWVSSPH